MRCHPGRVAKAAQAVGGADYIVRLQRAYRQDNLNMLNSSPFTDPAQVRTAQEQMRGRISQSRPAWRSINPLKRIQGHLSWNQTQ